MQIEFGQNRDATVKLTAGQRHVPLISRCHLLGLVLRCWIYTTIFISGKCDDASPRLIMANVGMPQSAAHIGKCCFCSFGAVLYYGNVGMPIRVS